MTAIAAADVRTKHEGAFQARQCAPKASLSLPRLTAASHPCPSPGGSYENATPIDPNEREKMDKEAFDRRDWEDDEKFWTPSFWKLVSEDLQQTEWPSLKKVWQTFLISQVRVAGRPVGGGCVFGGWLFLTSQVRPGPAWHVGGGCVGGSRVRWCVEGVGEDVLVWRRVEAAAYAGAAERGCGVRWGVVRSPLAEEVARAVGGWPHGSARRAWTHGRAD
jgi:hypothetical protein